jgi:hypothetical protein
MYEGMQGTADKRAQDEGSCSGVVLPTDIRLPRLYTFHPSAPSVLCMPTRIQTESRVGTPSLLLADRVLARYGEILPGLMTSPGFQDNRRLWCH